MKKNNAFYALFASIITLALTATVLSIGSTIALYGKTVSDNGTYGEVSLRSYYECGSGTEEDPFVITRPRHLYNFSRLHGLGLYGEKAYFQLGKVDLGGIDSNGQPLCYADDSSNTRISYLDMSSSDFDTIPINAIGSEALPFYGEFDGQDVEIKNLNVYANPEDAGLFGYTAHGSSVHNLFLSEVTIHALGYTSGYADLYSPESTIGNNVSFVYNPNDGSGVTTSIDKEYGNTLFSYFYANNTTDFEYTAQGSSSIPTVTINAPSNSYVFTSLVSGDLITINEQNQIVPDMDRLFEFFKEKKNEDDAKFPLLASSSVSLVASSTDRYGQKHSKVILSLEYDFTLESASSSFISMGVRVGGKHNSNIGLVVGHCDGSVFDCYVYNGHFRMNDGGAGYSRLANGSNLGLIGLVGGTVQNILANESDVGAKEGKNIGVLDFTTIYRDIIDNNSFAHTTDIGGISSYVPSPLTKYLEYLRYDNNNTYVTQKVDSVSFRGRTIVTNTDLGVFTIATDSTTYGIGGNSGVNIDKSVVLTDDDLAIDDASGDNNYYIYYSTGEFNKSMNGKTGSNFSQYANSFNSQNTSDGNSHILPGHHFPRRNQISRESFEMREARQNYYLRFKLDPNYRRGKGFYFSDVDIDTDGGAFMANYFNYKLVDQNSHSIPIGNNKCGVMLKNNLRQDIGVFSASFALPDLSPQAVGGTPDAYGLEDAEGNKYVSNMINFEVKNDLANVTIVAAPTDNTKASVLGIYKLDDSDFSGSIDYESSSYEIMFNQKYDNPDYAFFMPSNSRLSYFDYRVNNLTKKGEIGTYASDGTFTVASNQVDATVPNEYGKTEFGYEAGKTRLFAHTFCLPRGRYCVGSASSTNGTNQCTPKVYYLCAQGQDDGQFDFDDTVFASNDRVEDVDFINIPRFANDGTENIVIADITTYNPSSLTEGNRLGNRRCYVALVNSDRSLFTDGSNSNLSFEYNPSNGKFVISSTTLNAIEHIAVDNYNHSYAGDPKQLTLVLFGIESNQTVIVYPAGN